MKTRAIQSIIIIFALIMLLVAGTTMAYFTDSDSAGAVAMTAGILDFDILPVKIDGKTVPSEHITWKAGTSKTFCWTFKNTGSKKMILRARPLIDAEMLIPGDETAWGEGQRFNPKGNWAMYFNYEVGAPELSVRLMAGQHYHVGYVRIWTAKEEGYIYVKYDFFPGFSMSESHLFVGDMEAFNEIKDNPAPGRLPFKYDEKRVAEYTYKISLSGIYSHGELKGKKYAWSEGDQLYIAAHAAEVPKEAGSVEADISWELAEGCPFKAAADEEGITWWYYCQPILPNEEITLCLIGTLPNNVPDGCKYTIQLMAEALQATHGAIDLWPHPCR